MIFILYEKAYATLLINSNLDPISHRFRDTTTHSLNFPKLFIENCSQTARLLLTAYIWSHQRLAPVRSYRSATMPHTIVPYHPSGSFRVNNFHVI